MYSSSSANHQHSLPAVIVGSLPALKLLLANRASAKRSRLDSAGSRKKQQFSNNSGSRGKSVPLSSLSSEKKSATGRVPGTADSQEEMLRSEGTHFVLVKHDVVSSTVPSLSQHRKRSTESHRCVLCSRLSHMARRIGRILLSTRSVRLTPVMAGLSDPRLRLSLSLSLFPMGYSKCYFSFRESDGFRSAKHTKMEQYTG